MISVRTLFLAGGLMTVQVCAFAADVRRFEENGSLIEETRQVERTPVAEVQMQEQKITSYTDRVVNDVRPQTQSYYVPVTEYRLVPRLEGRWNPFAEPRWVYDRVPYTRYELRTSTVNVPVARREQVPQTQTVQVPVRTLKFVNQEKVSRVVLGPATSSTNPTMVAQLPPTSNIPPPNMQPPATYGSNPGSIPTNPSTYSQPPANPNVPGMNASPPGGYGPTPDFYSTNPGGASQVPPRTNLPTMNMPSQPTYGTNPTVTTQNPTTYGPSAAPTYTNNGQNTATYGPSTGPTFANGQYPASPNGMTSNATPPNGYSSPGPVFTSQNPATVATRPPPLVGGISRFDSDPPRQPSSAITVPSLMR